MPSRTYTSKTTSSSSSNINKRVHFASVNTCYTIPSIAGSDGPSPLSPAYPLPPTWQSTQHRQKQHNAHTPASLVPSPRSGPLIHAILSASSTSNSTNLNLHWDISLLSSTCTSHYHFLSSSLLCPATDPPSTSITVVCRHLPWQFILPAISNGRYVTVQDVLDGLYMSMQRLATEERDFRVLPKETQRRVVRAYEKRCERAALLPSSPSSFPSDASGRQGRDAREKVRREREMGLRMVDYLMGCTWFSGLTVAKTAKGEAMRGVWTLNVQ